MIELSISAFAAIIVGTIAGTLFLTLFAIYVAFKCTWRDGIFTGPYGPWEGREENVESSGGSRSRESEVENISGVLPGGVGGGEGIDGAEVVGAEEGG